MTTYVQARNTLVTRITTALTADYPTLKVFWENATQVDINKVGNAFLQVEINFQDAVNTTIAPDALFSGEVNFRLFYKEGEGTLASLGIFDYLTNLMKFQTISGVTLNTPKPGRKQKQGGWASFDLNAPFSFMSI